jgi:very-short-patch-repair endonuclease
MSNARRRRPAEVARLARLDRARRTASIFEEQHGVASRRQLYAIGLRRWDIRVELRAGRWQRRGPQTVSDKTGPLEQRGQWWTAVLEIGAQAALDGVTALQAAGLKGFEEPVFHVSMPKSGRPRSWPDTRVHETRRRKPDDLVGAGIPRTRPAVAAVRGALWAKSDRQAALVLAMAVQQRLVTVEALAESMESVRRDRRRPLLLAVLSDLRGGAQSLSELDFAKLCREARLPEPDRQVLHDLGHRRAYVDAEWTSFGLVVEIDGIHHVEAPALIADALRQNDLINDRRIVLRFPVLGLRTDPDRFLAQIRTALLSLGWQPVTSEEAEGRTTHFFGR